ncbi:MAG: helix-turn-helix domain-containing protein [Planctomycetes bacterium]|nr:helix-turn-helix domain-containing protein [Planctomycetota bacterium]
MRTSPSKKVIADYLGLDRSTVSKILNHYNRDKFSTETIERVERAAQELGYAKSQRRECPRRDLTSQADFQVRERDAQVPAARGRGRIANISVSGLLLRDLLLDSTSLPARPFYLDLQVAEGELAGLNPRCRPVRFDASEGERMGFGLRFDELDAPQRNRVERFIDEGARG